MVNIYAAAPGTVLHVSDGQANVANMNGGGWGNYVVIDHGPQQDGKKLLTLYGHLRPSIPVSQGQSVGINTVLGLMGTTGCSTVQHLQFQVEKEDAAMQYSHHGNKKFLYTPVDPMTYLPSVSSNVPIGTLQS